MRNLFSSLMVVSLLITPLLNAQERYVDDLFSDVTVTSNVVYGANIGIITQAPALEDLTMDIYEPSGDDVTDRPVVVLLHTGTFLPAIVNGQATGDKSDNTLVELCTRLAKKGYVAVSANYRLGWNPLSSDPEVRTSTLAQAFYRAQQDARTAVRYLRMTAAEMGNPYGVGDKFAVGGDGTGGYMALALASLDKDSEVLLPKFIDSSDNAIATYGQPVPYIIQSMLGNLGGSNYGSTVMDLDGDGTPETEVPLCVPNHPDYSDAIDMAFNFGGAMLDTLWIEAGEAPIASFQNINDQFAPYDVDVLTEPVNNDPVIEAHGSLPLIRRATALGNNDCFAGLSTTLVDATYGNGDGAANAAAAGHADMSGLFPLVTPTPSATPTACGMAEWDGAPWQWWDNNVYAATAEAYNAAGATPYPASVWGCLATLSTPDMSEEKGLAFTDMLEEFFTPRIVAALELETPAGFFPPEGSTFNSDSSVVTLPGSSTDENYDQSISFYASEEISIPNVGSFGFVSAEITSVSTPEGMTSSCDPADCVFGPNAWGKVNLSGTPLYGGEYNLDLEASVTVDLISLFGESTLLTFPIPYETGDVPLLDLALMGAGSDASAINEFVPSFILNIEGDAAPSGCTDPDASNYDSNAVIDDGSCESEPVTTDGVRYVDEIFSDVTVTSNVVYGANIGIITQAPALEDLTMDIYTPVGDDVTERPVIVLLHTGTFLPAIVNGQATGDKSDNTLVELCTRLAKKGYVAVSANYRLGWNPLSSDPEVRTSTLAQAFYRAQQDARTAVRYLRMTAAEMGNPYGVGDKFAVGGDGTGGYMALALASLDKDSEVLLPKFIDSSDNAIATYGQPVPYIIQSMLGNLGGSNYGSTVMDLDGDGTPETEVPLCVPNHPDYSDAIDMAFNFGGAMLDTVWIEAGEAPIASFQNINDQFAPYDVDVLTEPVNNDPVIEAHGSLPLIRRATALGNNDCFAGLSTTLVDATYGNGDGAANAAAAGHADMPGLFPLVTPTPSATPTACGMAEWDGAPWQWWDNNVYAATAEAYNAAGATPYPASVWGCLATLSTPDMSEEKGLAFTDMLEEFFTPRIVAALELEPKRYVDEIFSEVSVEQNVVYGANIGIITQAPALEDLTMDIYTPVGDDVTDRRVVVLLHTGTFLPAIVNGQATGDKSDNTLVELCTRLAKKGYVAVSANYRLGWNPLSSDPEVRTSTLAQAFYRAQQDARTAVRYLRMTAAEMGNPYGVGDKFAVGGDGTGGYMALALASLDKDSEVLLPKFIDSSDNAIATYGQPVPYIIQSMLGNLGGSNYGSTVMDLDGDGTPETEVPLCVPNHPDYSDAIDMAFNFGGAMLDTLWIEAGEAPIASFQNINDQFAPYDVDVLTEPVNNDPVIEAHGSLPLIRRATALGNNDCFAGLSTTLVDATYGNGDGAANAAAAGHADMPGLFPLVTPTPSATPTACGMAEWDGAPWQWWDNNVYAATAEAYNAAGATPYPASVWGCLATLSTPDMSEEKGLAFTDMLEEFFTPRIDAALSLDNSSQDNGPDNQALDFPAGWSMFSTYMLADDMALDAILNPILPNVIIAKDYLGSAFLPEFNFNGVGDLTVGWGYQIKTAEASSLTVTGTYMTPEENSVALSAGWNMIGYLRMEAAPADLVLAELNDAGNLVIAKNYLGSAFLPEFNFNGIGDLEPGQGYQLKTNEAGTLNFLSNDNAYRLSAMEVTYNDLRYFELATNTGSNMTISILADAWKTFPTIGDEIAAYNSKGELVGSAIYTDPVSVISVWGNDATTEKVDGLNNGEAMKFKLWNKRFNTTQELIVKEWVEGANAYQTDAVYQIGAIEAVEYTTSINQLGVYPIPAKHELNIDLELGQSEAVTVSIYNLIGELMETNSYEMSKGINTIQLDIDGLKDGVYLCKVNSGNNQMTRKFNVLK